MFLNSKSNMSIPKLVSSKDKQKRKDKIWFVRKFHFFYKRELILSTMLKNQYLSSFIYPYWVQAALGKQSIVYINPQKIEFLIKDWIGDEKYTYHTSDVWSGNLNSDI